MEYQTIFVLNDRMDILTKQLDACSKCVYLDEIKNILSVLIFLYNLDEKKYLLIIRVPLDTKNYDHNNFAAHDEQWSQYIVSRICFVAPTLLLINVFVNPWISSESLNGKQKRFFKSFFEFFSTKKYFS